MIFGMNWLDFSILMAYFAIILYIGVFKGGQKTKTLGVFLSLVANGDPSRVSSYPGQIQKVF